jgi:hypothetical protein
MIVQTFVPRSTHRMLTGSSYKCYSYNFFAELNNDIFKIQCGVFGMFIPDPDFYPSRIPDLGSRIQKPQQKRGVKKKFDAIPFYVASNFTKLYIILVLK